MFPLTILITGCTPGGTGASLATTLHKLGHTVIATARTPSKLLPLSTLGIQVLSLDITSSASITAAVTSLSTILPHGRGLNMLVNNAGGTYITPVSDLSLPEARELFDLNVWSHIEVTQAFLPLLLLEAGRGGNPAQSMIVNHTSVGSMGAIPFQGVYNASKAAMAMFSATLRLELAAFGVTVVDLKTAGVKTNFIANGQAAERKGLKQGSIYTPAQEVVERSLNQEGMVGIGIEPDQWAREVVTVLLGKSVPRQVWKGESAWLAWFVTVMPVPSALMEGVVKRLTGLDKVERIIGEAKKTR